MDSLSPQVVSAAKLPILNHNEFDLWKMRIEQYFLMTDYSLWEVILNGDSLVPTRVIEDAKTLMEATEKRFGGNIETKKVQKTLLKQQFEHFTGTASQNLAFMSSSHTDSTTDPVSAAASVFAVCAKLPVSSLPNVDSSLPNALIYYFFASKSTNPQLDNKDLKQAEILVLRDLHLWVLICLKWSVKTATERDILLGSVGLPKIQEELSYQAEEEPVNYSCMSFLNSSSDNEPSETSTPAATPAPASPKSTSYSKRRNRKACFVCKSVDHLIKDYDYHDKKMAQPTQRNYAHRVTKSKSPIRRDITRSPSPKTSNSPPRVTAVKAPVISAAQGVQETWGNPQHALKDKGVIDSGCSRHMTGNMSYLFNFEELNSGYVAFGGNPKGGKISGKEKIKTCKLDFDDVYFVKELKFNHLSVSQMYHKKNSVLFTNTECLVLSPDFKFPDESQVEAINTTCYVQNRVLVTKPHIKTPYELLHGQAPSIGFMRPFGCLVTILNTLDSLGKFKGKVDEGFLVVYSVNSKAFKNHDGDAAFDEKDHDFDAKKPEFEVILSLSRYRDLNTEFEDCSDNSSNEVNTAGSIVPTIWQNSFNSTNTFSAVGPSNAAVSPTYGKSSFIDASQLPNDPDMPELEDITYSDDEDVVGVVIRNKARLVTQGHTQEERIDYEEVLALVARIEAIRLFLAYASFIGFMVYQMDVKSAFLYGTIEEEVYVCQPLGFKDHDHPDKVYKVVKALYGLHQAPRACQDKYVAEILRKFGLTEGKSASTPIDTEKPLLKDPDGKDVDVHIYRSMIGSLMYLTSSRPDIMFAVCACARFQMTPKALHLHVVKRIFRYLKGKPHLGLWYPKDSPFDLMAYSDSDYVGASLDIKSTTEGCQFFRCRLISWQCKKQTVVATSSIEAEYVATASCCTQVIWIQNQLLDYGHKLLLFSLTNWCCSLSAVRSSRLMISLGVDCLANEEIFTELARMGYEKPSTKLTFYKAFFSSQWKFLIHTILHSMSAKRTSWNDFSSAMASAAICLSTGKGFSGVETPLFEGMLVGQVIKEEGDAEEHIQDVNDGDVAQGDDTAAYGEVPTVS
nr:uncharacterized mitochondrial protein AtMg00810-like [Tanacetum cinerariifolium]